MACSDRFLSVVERGSIPRLRAGDPSLEFALEVALEEYLELLLDCDVEGYPDSPVPPAYSLCVSSSSSSPSSELIESSLSISL
jgi:hypothetical protein